MSAEGMNFKFKNPAAYRRIRKQIREYDVVLYMELECPSTPIWLKIVLSLGIDSLLVVGVRQDPEIWNSITFFANYPDFPLLFIKGEFAYGSFEIRNAFESGDLAVWLENEEVKLIPLGECSRQIMFGYDALEKLIKRRVFNTLRRA